MNWVIEDDVRAYAARVLPLIEREPVAHNLHGTLIVGRASGGQRVEPGALWAWLDDGNGTPAAVALRTPPYPLLVSVLPSGAAESLCELLGAADVAGFSGRREDVAALAAAWAAQGWPAPELKMSQLLYELTAVKSPPPVPGRLRAASEADIGQIVTWTTAFQAEIGEDQPPAVVRALTEARLGVISLWEVDGQPVSMALANRPMAGVSRVGLVYTPPDRRRRGYASALVAGVSQRALDDGAQACMLYTDAENPTSNAIYQAIGYRLVATAEVRRFP
jgi:predicted GNAT family acetyltransferase